MKKQDRIFLSPPHLEGKERQYVNETFDSNWIAPLGPQLDAFEADLAAYCGVEHAAGLSSGTAALHLALIMLGVGPGDEVIVSSFTFSASVNPIVYQGATPVLVDSEPETWNMSPGLLHRAIEERIALGKKPKAIVLVHLYGMPAKLDEILELACHYGIPVIEDAAEALGSKYKGRALASFGEMSMLSFNGNKIITTSGGGALLSNRGDFIAQARFLSSQAREDAPYYHHTQIGYNYRMSNVLAAIGRGQLEVLDERIAQTRHIFSSYRKGLADIPGLVFHDEPEAGFFSNRWLTCVLLPPKTGAYSWEPLMAHLEEHNIESRPLWKPMHLQPVFSDCPAYLNGVSESLFSRGLCLPSGTALRNADLDRIIGLIRGVLV
ncbi:MAG: pyridoxal phosphate-dependent aminotransferase [Bacteroidetes bacterium]|nr:MAG: pyridoxal phosphate-dependent aminotransferase [Bacteroidota bacterium]